MQSTPIFSTRLGMIETRLALPQRSPNPLIVPCTCSTPSLTAASELATAHSASLWTWMPRRAGTSRFTTWRIATRSWGSVPPLVSQSTTQCAPAPAAAFSVAEHFFDGFRANREYALATLKAAARAGAHWGVLCDTNGGTRAHGLGAGLPGGEGGGPARP